MARLDSYDLAMATIKMILLNRFTKPPLDYSRSNVLLKSIGIVLFRGHISIGTIGLRVIFPVYLTKPWVGLKSSSLKGGRWGGGGSLKGNGTYLTRCMKTTRISKRLAGETWSATCFPLWLHRPLISQLNLSKIRGSTNQFENNSRPLINTLKGFGITLTLKSLIIFLFVSSWGLVVTTE